MSEKEIKDLASAYAESATIGLEPHDIEEQRRIEYDFALPVLEWLSSRYCLVEKSKIHKWIDESELTILDSIDLIEIFNDLFGKELFTDTEQ